MASIALDYLEQNGYNRGRDEGRAEGRKDGENSFFNAMSLIKNNTPLSDVSKTTGIDISRLQSMRDMMFAH